MLFVDTGRHFPETLRYRDALVDRLGLHLRIVSPDERTVREEDPDRTLAKRQPDECCRIRKTFPLQDALAGYDCWLTGRKRMHGGARSTLPYFERDGTHVKINPLATWDRATIAAYFTFHELPRHPLEGQGFPSIGCEPCTSRAAPGSEPRAGRWAGLDKTECGIHMGPDGKIVRGR